MSERIWEDSCENHYDDWGTGGSADRGMDKEKVGGWGLDKKSVLVMVLKTRETDERATECGIQKKVLKELPCCDRQKRRKRKT